MPRHRNREEAINTQLAVLISGYGVKADAETIHLRGLHRPDVLFEMRGLRIAIEGKFPDHPSAMEAVSDDARRRVRSGLTHIAAAVVYPIALRTTSTSEILDELSSSSLKFKIITEYWEGQEWFDGSPLDLMGALRRAQEALTEDNIVEQIATSLQGKLDGIAHLWSGHSGALKRLASLLGLTAPVGETVKEAQERAESVAKVAALVLANALVFQEQLAKADERVETLKNISLKKDLTGSISKHWRWIWENINYVPIFQLGERVLNELPDDKHSTLAVKTLLQEARSICEQQAALRHDLMGRIYHWLLHHAKFLGTFYTSVSAATLLLKLSLDLEWKNDFGDLRQVADFKVADLACGTGTLLMASAQALTDNFIRARVADARVIDEKSLAQLHSTLMQNVLHGYDILPSAVHLTASTLALLAPEVAFRQMNLFVMPIGIDQTIPRLGSLDFFDGGEIKTQFALDNSQLDVVKTGAGNSHYSNAKVPKLDLCVMNPPFVSSRKGNRLFGSLPKERAVLQKSLSERAKAAGVTTKAGLGAMFVSLADKHIKPGGRMAFVLPIALTTGESWAPIRNLISSRYHLEVVISSHDNNRQNFSENTELSELLFIARRLLPKEKAGGTCYVNLWSNATSIHAALDHATRISASIRSLQDKIGQSQIIRGAAEVIGELTVLPRPTDDSNWTGAIFAQSTLMKMQFELDNNNKLHIPHQKAVSLPLCALGTLGGLGYDARDIADAFEVDRSAQNWTPYAGFWDHDAEKVTSIAQKPNAYLTARTEAIEGRKLKSADVVWSKSGQILLVSRLRTNTQKVIATGFSCDVIGNTWWSFDTSNLKEKEVKSLLLWLNSTLGILQYFGRRVITQGAWMQMKKPAWQAMPVLNVKQLSPIQLNLLASMYDRLSTKTLRPISGLNEDETRKEIDEGLAKILKFSDLSDIRLLLSREPGLTAKVINHTADAPLVDGEEEPLLFAV